MSACHNIEERHVVVVDDDELTLEMVRRSFRQTPVQLLCFAHELEALDYLQEYSPDLILIDHRMPKLDGLQLLSQLVKLDALRPSSAYLCSSVMLPDAVRVEALRLGVRPLLKDVYRDKDTLLMMACGD